jgi:hypothetical protein
MWKMDWRHLEPDNASFDISVREGPDRKSKGHFLPIKRTIFFHTSGVWIFHLLQNFNQKQIYTWPGAL